MLFERQKILGEIIFMPFFCCNCRQSIILDIQGIKCLIYENIINFS